MGLPRAAEVRHGAAMNRPRFLLTFFLGLLALGASGCMSSKKNKDPKTVARFMIEAPARSTGVSVRLPKSGTTMLLSPNSFFTEYDIVKCEVIDNELGKSLLFQLTERAARDLFRMTATNQGRRLVTVVNGIAIGAQRIDAPISNGYIVTYVEVEGENLEIMAKYITSTSVEAREKAEKIK